MHTKICLPILISITFLFSGCGKQTTEVSQKQENNYKLFTHGSIPTQEDEIIEGTTTEEDEPTSPKELDFEVVNKTNKTIYVTCFSYIQKEPFTRWRWDKSPIYKLDIGQRTVINVDTIPDQEHRDHIFGYLGVFENEKEAHDAIYELTEDRKKIDIDIIAKLKNKKVIIGIEKYGFKPDKYDVMMKNKFQKKTKQKELDFIVKNETGKTIFITTFVYQIQDNIHQVWEYDKTAILKLENGQSTVVNIESIDTARDREFMYGHLAVFDEDEETEAHDSTYELLEQDKKISLGKLSRLEGQKVVINVEKYGTVGKITEFDLQPNNPAKNNNRILGMINKKSITKKKKTKKEKNNQKVLPQKNNGNYQFFS